MYFVMCTMYLVMWTMYFIMCTMYFVMCTMYLVMCTMYFIMCTMYFVLCKIYFSLYTLLGSFRKCCTVPSNWKTKKLLMWIQDWKQTDSILPWIICWIIDLILIAMIQLSCCDTQVRHFIRKLTLCMLGNFSWFFCHLLTFSKITFSKNSFRNTIRESNSFDPDQDWRFVGPDPVGNHF